MSSPLAAEDLHSGLPATSTLQPSISRRRPACVEAMRGRTVAARDHAHRSTADELIEDPVGADAKRAQVAEPAAKRADRVSGDRAPQDFIARHKVPTNDFRLERVEIALPFDLAPTDTRSVGTPARATRLTPASCELSEREARRQCDQLLLTPTGCLPSPGFLLFSPGLKTRKPNPGGRTGRAPVRVSFANRLGRSADSGLGMLAGPAVALAAGD